MQRNGADPFKLPVTVSPPKKESLEEKNGILVDATGTCQALSSIECRDFFW